MVARVRTMRQGSSRLVAVAAVLVLLACQAHAALLSTVATKWDGVDSETCGLQEQPCRSIDHAITRAEDGGSIVLAALTPVEDIPSSMQASYNITDTVAISGRRLSVESAVPSTKPIVRCLSGSTAFYAIGPANITFSNLQFYNCGSVTSSGGVVKANDTAVVSFTSCVFKSNRAADGAVAFADDNAHVSFDDCEFTENAAANTGGIATLRDSATMSMNASQVGQPFTQPPHCAALPPGTPFPTSDPCGPNATQIILSDDVADPVQYVIAFQSLVQEGKVCNWEVVAPEGTMVRADFCNVDGVLFFLDPCTNNQQRMIMTDPVTGLELFNECGTMRPVISPSNRMHVQYIANDPLFVSQMFFLRVQTTKNNMAVTSGGLVAATNSSSAKISNSNVYGGVANAGGVVYVSDTAKVDVSNSNSDGAASTLGGVVYADSYAEVQLSSIVATRGLGAQGVGISCSANSSVSMTDSSIQNMMSGSAIVATTDSAKLSVTGGTMTGNQGAVGGVFDLSGDSRGTFAGTSITQNQLVLFTGTSFGAAMKTSGTASAFIVNSTLNDNTSNQGAALGVLDNSRITIHDSQMSNNIASRWGGVASLRNTAQLSMLRCTFTANVAGKGAVTELRDDSMATFNNCTLLNNNAKLGGGIADMWAGTVVMKNCSVIGSVVDGLGGGVFSVSVYSTLLNVTDSIFKDNKAPAGQGAVLVVKEFSNDGWSYATFDRCSFINNIAGGRAKPGGAMYASDVAYLTVTNSLFRGNSAGYGGAIGVEDGAELTCNNTVFDGNHATISGGAIALNVDASAVLENCKFTLNAAASTEDTSGGGAVFIGPDGQLAVKQTQFVNNFGKNGGAVMITTTEQQGPVPLKFSCEHCNFEGNSANTGSGGVVSVTTTSTADAFVNVSLSYCQMHSNSASTGGVASLFGNVVFDLFFSDVSGNSASQEGGVLSSSTFPVITIANTTMSNNQANSGGIMYLDIVSTARVTGSTFTSNAARGWGSGGVVAIGRHSQATLTDCGAFNNRAADGAVFYSLLDAQVFAARSNFSNNVAVAGGAVVASYSASTQVFDDCEMSGNTAVIGGVVACMQESVVTMTNCHQRQNQGTSGGVVFVTNAGNVVFVGGSLIGNFALEQGGAIEAQSASSVSMSDMLLEGNEAAKSGGVVDASGAAAITLTRCQLLRNDALDGGGATFQQKSSAVLVNCTMSGNHASIGGAMNAGAGSVVHMNGGSMVNNLGTAYGGGLASSGTAAVTLDGVVISDNNGGSGGGVYCGDNSVFTASRVTITRNTAATSAGVGGGVMLADETKAWLTDSTITNNVAGQGGALATEASTVVKLLRCQLSNNRASTQGGAVFQDLTAVPSGGSVHDHGTRLAEVSGLGHSQRHARRLSMGGTGMMPHMGPQPPKLWLDYCTMNSNSAPLGAVVQMTGPYLNPMSTYLNITNSWISNNYALQGGGVLFWTMVDHPLLTASSKFEFMFNTQLFNNTAVFYGATIGTGPTSIVLEVQGQPLAAPGQVLEITVQSSKPVASFIRAFALDGREEPMSGSLLELLVRVSVSEASIAQYPQTRVYGQTLNSGGYGSTTFSELTIDGPPGEQIVLDFTSVEPAHLVPTQLRVNLAGCVRGEFLSHTQCLPCEEGTYSWDDGTVVACKQCPANAVCPGGSIVIAQQNYWRTGPNSTQMILCPNPEACEGALPYSQDPPDVERCKPGYTGNLCGACDHGFAHSDRLTCSECPSSGNNMLVLFGVLLAAAVVAVVVVQIQRHIGKKGMDVMTMVVKILTSYYQFVSVANSLDVFWPPAVLDLFSLQSSITSAGGRLMFVECLIKDPSLSIEAVFYTKELLYILVAPGMVVVSVVVWGSVFLYRRHCRRNERRTAAQLVSIATTNCTVTVIVILFLLHPSVTVKVLELVTCVEVVAGSGELYLQSELDIACWTQSHTMWVLFAAVPAFIFIVGGVPAAAFLLLKSLSGSLNEDFVKEKYGFLFLGYSRRCYYWEIVVVARKVGIILAAELLAQFGFMVQILGALTVTFIAYLTHVGANPYVNEKLDRLDRAALLISLATFAMGAFLKADNIQSWVQVAVAFAVIITNVAFVLFVFWYVRNETIVMVKESWNDALSMFSFCRCRCCKPANVKSEPLEWSPGAHTGPMGKRDRANPLVQMSDMQNSHRGAAPARNKKKRRNPGPRLSDPAMDSCVL